ncbi:SGNH/GDSL hydrolase family protein, partial [Candidatus Peregrinibacteria bacterium]|nr:SGNH/GDSL hydrolase family protein [Candidatus Peregrinibacteria bacterium]
MLRLARYGNLLLLSGAITVTLLSAEATLRLFGVSYPYWSRVDPLTGFSPRPGVSGWVHDEGDAFVRINSNGFRDREHSVTKPNDTLRIAVLGDSMTEARQVDVTQTFWSILEQNLSHCAGLEGRTPEVMNFGVSGYGTGQEYLLLERIWRFQPDIVLLAFYPGNDVLNNSRELEHSMQKPYIDENSGELVPDFSFHDTPFYRRQRSLTARFLLSVIDHSHIAQSVSQAFRTFRRFRQIRQSASSLSPEGTPGSPETDPELYRPPTIASHVYAWHITERLLSAMAAQTRLHDARFAVMVIPLPETIHPDPSVRSAETRVRNIPDLFYAENRIAMLGLKERFPVFALGRRMQNAAEANGTFYNGFPRTKPGTGHLNAAGHAVAGSLISEDMCSWI